MLGTGVQPGMFMQDYSGFAQAGAMQGKMLAGIGQSIASGIEGFQEKKKEQSNIERQIKKADNVAKAIADLVPELAPTIEASRAELNDLNIPQNDRLAIAEGINDILNIGLGEVKRQRESVVQSQELAARLQEQRMKPPTLAELPVPGGTQTVEWNPDIGAWVEPSFDLAAPPVGLVPEQIQELLKTYPREEVEGIVSDALRQSGVSEKEIPMETQIAIDGVLGDVLPPVKTRVGFEPAKTIDEGLFRQATPEQAASYGAAAGQFGPDGRFYPINPPSGMSVKTNPDGTFEFVQGSGIGMSKQQIAAEAAQKQSFERTRAITGAAAGIITPIQESLSQGAVGARLDQAVSAWLPASQQGRIAADLETIRVQTSKEEIGNMRASSPTGSAGGQITEREWPKFENRFGKLEVGLNAKDLTRNLQLTVLNQFEATNGTPEDVIKLLDDGKISQATFDNYVDEYKNTRSALGIPNTGVEGRLYGWTKFDNRLMQKYSKAGQVFSSPEAEAIRARMQSLQSR